MPLVYDEVEWDRNRRERQRRNELIRIAAERDEVDRKWNRPIFTNESDDKMAIDRAIEHVMHEELFENPDETVTHDEFMELLRDPKKFHDMLTGSPNVSRWNRPARTGEELIPVLPKFPPDNPYRPRSGKLAPGVKKRSYQPVADRFDSRTYSAPYVPDSWPHEPIVYPSDTDVDLGIPVYEISPESFNKLEQDRLLHKYRYVDETVSPSSYIDPRDVIPRAEDIPGKRLKDKILEDMELSSKPMKNLGTRIKEEAENKARKIFPEPIIDAGKKIKNLKFDPVNGHYHIELRTDF